MTEKSRQHVPPSSPSDANSFDALPYAWWWKHGDHWGYKAYRSPGAPRMDRGTAIEPGMSYLVDKGVTDEATAKAKEIVRDRFLRLRQDPDDQGMELDETKLNQEELIEWHALDLYINSIAAALISDEWREANLGFLVREQARVTLDVQTSLAIQTWRGFIDYQFDNACVDLKTTMSVPNGSMRQDHVLQTAFYSDATGGTPQYCLYVKPVGLTPGGKVSKAKGWSLLRLTDRQHASGSSRRPALSTAMANIYQMDTRSSKLVCYPRDPSQFRWDDELRDRAKKEWGVE
jgi:hypothetical protein